MIPEPAFAGAAVGKGDVPGGAVEALSVSDQIGAQNEVQLGTAPLTLGGETNSFQVRTPEVEAHAGAFNADGSEGVNAGASLNLVAAETTVGAGGNSLTAGVNVGWGGEISAGQRDADGDGQGEVCVRAGLSLQALPVGITVGACVEPEGIYAGLKALVGAGQ